MHSITYLSSKLPDVFTCMRADWSKKECLYLEHNMDDYNIYTNPFEAYPNKFLNEVPIYSTSNCS